MNEKFLDKESITSYERSDIIITIFLAILDSVVIVISLINIRSKTKIISQLKQKIIKVFIIDIIIRILYSKKYNTWNIYKEILLSIFNTCLFFLVISFFDQVLYNPNWSSLKQSKELNKRVRLCLVFFFSTFSYQKIPFISSNFYVIKFNKLFLVIQCLFIIYCLYKFHEEIKSKISKIANNFIKETNSKKNIYLLILGSPLSCLILVTIYFLLKIISIIFIKSPVYAIYTNIILNIIKETSKYFSFFICEAIIYVINQIKMSKEQEIKKKYNDYTDEVDEIIN